jgi:hypothetical protein
MTRRRGEGEKPGVNEFTAHFDGLVDLVLDARTGRVKFWCRRPKGTATAPYWFVERVVKPGGGDSGEQVVWVPPAQKDLPWLLPRHAEVERYFVEDTDEQYFAALCEWIESNVDLPKPEHTTLLAGWIAHSYFIDLVHASPYVLLLGPPEAGKTRALEACIHASRRGVLMPDAREAAVIRYTAHHHATLALDVIDFIQAIKPSMDIFAARTKNNGTVTTRVIDPKKGPFEGGVVQFVAFGATIAASNAALSNEVIASRTLPIQMREVDHPGRPPITPELARTLRERGTAFRARMLMRASDGTLPNPPRVARGRLGEIMSPLVLAVHVCAPAQLSALEALARDFDDARRVDVRDTMEVELLQHCIELFQEASNGAASVDVLLKTLVRNVHMERQESGEYSPSSRKIAAILRTHFEIIVRRGTGNATCLTLSERRLATLAKKYGLEFRPQEAPSRPTPVAANPAVAAPTGSRHRDAPLSAATQPVTVVADCCVHVNGEKRQKSPPEAQPITQVNQIKKKKKEVGDGQERVEHRNSGAQ